MGNIFFNSFNWLELLVHLLKKMGVLLKFLVVLGTVLWITLKGLVKLIFPSRKKKDLTKEIVLITGSGSGIGRLMALKFAELGAKLVLWDINREANEAVKEEVKALGGEAHAFKVDCSKREEIYKVAEKVDALRDWVVM